MKNEDTHTDKELQGLFHSYEPPVPMGAWKGIEHKLDVQHRRRNAFWWFAAAVMLICVTAAIWLGLSNQVRTVTEAPQRALAQKQMESYAKPEPKKEPAIKESREGTREQGFPHVDHTIGKLIMNPKMVGLDASQNAGDTQACLGAKEYSIVWPEPFGIPVLTIPVPTVNESVIATVRKPSSFKCNTGKWTLAAGMMQNLSANGYTINQDYRSYVHKNYLSHMEQGEQAMGSTGFFLQLGYQIHKKFALTGGFQFRQLNTRQQFSFSDEVPVTLMPGNTPDKFGNYPIIGYFGSTGNVSYNGFQRNTMIEIPLGVRAEFPLSKIWTLQTATTINTGIVSGINGFTLDYQQLQLVAQRSEWYRSVQFSGALSVGACRQISRKLQWGATLGATRMLTPAYVPDASIRPRNNALGLGTQLIWRID